MHESLAGARALQVLVVAGVKACRDALVTALNTRQGIMAFGQALVSPAAFKVSYRTEFDVIVVDASAPRGVQAITALHGQTIGVPVIALGVESESTDIIVCAEAGAAGYVSADASLDELVEAINDVISGRLACPPKIAFDLFRLIGSARMSHRTGATEFTPREQEVLQLLSDGQSNKEIARSLGIAVSTVKNHVHHILEKSEVCSRKHAARKSTFLLATSPKRGVGPKDLVPSLVGI